MTVSPRLDCPEGLHDSEARSATTQALFREINERVREINAAFDLIPAGEWFCECEDVTCFDRIEMSVEEYESVRLYGARFVVSPGQEHHRSDVDREIVERHDRYWVIENTGRAGELAKGSDPRSQQRPLTVRT